MTMLLAAATASAACPAEWLKLCPDQDCVPLQAPFPTHEVLGFRAGMYGCGGAGCYQNSWTQYNYSIVKTVLNGDFVINLTNIACQQHARGGRVTVGHALGFGAFNHTRLYDAAYRTAWVTAGVKVMKTSYPFVDGVNVDLERFPRNYITPYGLTDLVCEMHTQLQVCAVPQHLSPPT